MDEDIGNTGIVSTTKNKTMQNTQTCNTLVLIHVALATDTRALGISLQVNYILSGNCTLVAGKSWPRSYSVFLIRNKLIIVNLHQ